MSACVQAHTRAKTRRNESCSIVSIARVASFPFSLSHSHPAAPLRPRGPSSFCLPSRGGGGGGGGGGRSPSGANPTCTFVCLNWVAFYARASNVNRILNYYSDCVSPAPRYLLATLLISERATDGNFRVVSTQYSGYTFDLA